MDCHVPAFYMQSTSALVLVPSSLRLLALPYELARSLANTTPKAKNGDPDEYMLQRATEVRHMAILLKAALKIFVTSKCNTLRVEEDKHKLREHETERTYAHKHIDKETLATIT